MRICFIRNMAVEFVMNMSSRYYYEDKKGIYGINSVASNAIYTKRVMLFHCR